MRRSLLAALKAVTSDYYDEEKEVQERQKNRVDAAGDETDDHRLPNLHTIVPDYNMKRIPYQQGQKKINIYRSVPTKVTVINPGSWVGLTRKYADQLDRGVLLTLSVNPMDVYWAGTNENEFFYIPL